MTESALVECYSGFTYAQEPRALVVQGRRLAVTAVRRRWREPGGPRFVVSVDDGGSYLLAFDDQTAVWELAPACSTPRLAEAWGEIMMENEGVDNDHRGSQGNQRQRIPCGNDAGGHPSTRQ